MLGVEIMEKKTATRTPKQKRSIETAEKNTGGGLSAYLRKRLLQYNDERDRQGRRHPHRQPVRVLQGQGCNFPGDPQAVSPDFL